MAKIISKTTTTLKIPPNFKGLTGKQWLVIDFEADTPTEVPDNVAAYYVKSWSNKFRYAKEEVQISPLGNEGNKNNTPPPPEEFEPIKFLEQNYDRIEDAVNELTDRKQILKLCESLHFKGYHTQKTDRLKERIINDIEVKKKQEEEIKMNKGAVD